MLSTDGFPVLSTSSGAMRYSYKDLLSLTVLEQHFWFFQRQHSCKIVYNRVEGGLYVSLKQHFRILGHCEQIHTNEHHLTRLPCKEGKEEIKDNPQAYTIHKGIGENNTNPTVHYPMWAWKI